MRFLSLFSGIGGLDLGLEWAGWTCAGMCEFDPWCRALLAERFPGVPIHDDVTTLHPEPGGFDAVVGGFPCQDISSAGKGAGLDGERSGLWKEMHRVIRLVRPRWVVAENVPALRTRGSDRVLGDLERAGYQAWPLVVGADDITAPHRRKRVFIVGLLGDSENHDRWPLIRPARSAQRWGGRLASPSDGAVCDGDGIGHHGQRGAGLLHCERSTQRDDADGYGGTQLAHCGSERLEGYEQAGPAAWATGRGGGATFCPRPFDYTGWRMVLEVRPELAPAQTQSVVCRMADGLPERLGRRWRRRALKGLGNAVVPQVGQLIGETINRFEAAKKPDPS